MAFPLSPTNGQLYTTALGTQYIYVEADTAWKIYGTATGAVGGEGTENYIPKWADSTTLTDSATFETAAYQQANTGPVTAGFSRYYGVRHAQDNGYLDPNASITIADVSDCTAVDDPEQIAYIVGSGHMYCTYVGGSSDTYQATFLAHWYSVGFTAVTDPTVIYNSDTAGKICVVYDNDSILIKNNTDSTYQVGYTIDYYPCNAVPT